ncbi:hypothetical protein QTP88_005764 [Uroleucon formosanum]
MCSIDRVLMKRQKIKRDREWYVQQNCHNEVTISGISKERSITLSEFEDVVKRSDKFSETFWRESDEQL